jgi:membrane-associated protease RseP (regulator of RpoE activity)
MSIDLLRGAARWALVAAVVVGAVAIVHAQQDESQDKGRVVQIGRADEEAKSIPAPDRGANRLELNENDVAEQQEVPRYWIGLLGGPIVDDHPLRAHLNLPADQGLLVADVVPDSPASKAGLKKHDILLRANDEELHDMSDLVELVGTEGEKKGQIALEVFRRGERETIYLTPEERPADAYASPGAAGGFGRGAGLPEGVGELLGQLERGGQMPFNFRNFGPGVIVGGGRGMANVPNGVSVSIQKQDGQPARITVKRGEETWEVVGDDPESLEQLPEDLRPFVDRMLHGGSPAGFDFQMPNFEGMEGRGLGDERLQDRLEQMERRMEELQRRLLGPNDGAADEPNAEEEEVK